MASSPEQLSIEYQEFNLTIYTNGTIHRVPYTPDLQIAACPCPSNPDEVASKDVTLNFCHGTWLRLFLPPTPPHHPKLPILLHFHGGGLMHFSPSLRPLHAYLCRLAAHINAIIISVDYRLAPEHPLPAAYEDCFEALLWVDKQAALGPSGEPWLADHGNFSRCFLGGDSAGGTIAHYVAMQAVGQGAWKSEQDNKGLEHVSVKGMLLFHPFFSCGRQEELPSPAGSRDSKIFNYLKVTADHPLVDPLSPSSPPLAALPRACIFVAGRDPVKQGARVYYEALVQAGKEAKLSCEEEEDHVFYILKPDSPNVIAILDEARDFIHAS